MKTAPVTVYVIMVNHPFKGWTRVGRIYRDKEACKSWVPFVKSAWIGCMTRSRAVKIETEDGKPTAKAVQMMSEIYNCDLTSGVTK